VGAGKFRDLLACSTIAAKIFGWQSPWFTAE
jgi:hypothetical protein